MRRTSVAGTILRYLCLLTALANMGGNVLLQLFYRPLFVWLGVPLPTDLRAFVLESVLSFAMGVVALLVFLHPRRGIGLLQIGILGKGGYALVTYFFYAVYQLHGFYLVFVVWDAVFVVVFFLYWIHLESPELVELQQAIFDGIHQDRTNRALLIGFSLTDNGKKGMQHLAAGLESKGYEVDILPVIAQEAIFRFPMSFGGFVSIVMRAFVRHPAKIAPLQVPHHDYDLVVVESPTWLLGIAAPVEAVLQHPENRALFAGRDAVALVVCRGAHRRTQAMLVRWLERCGANVVAARAYAHVGHEPRRLLSLWFYLIFRRPGFPPGLAEKHYGLSDETLRAIKIFGAQLADRQRTRPHWTLMLPKGHYA
jgi:hypothetical protein